MQYMPLRYSNQDLSTLEQPQAKSHACLHCSPDWQNQNQQIKKIGSNTQTVSYHRASLSSTRQKPLEFVAKTKLVQVIVPSQVLHHHESHCQLLSCTSEKCEEGRLPRLSQVKTSEMIVTIALPCAIYHNNIQRITNQS
jgi:hypothetical protein